MRSTTAWSPVLQAPKFGHKALVQAKVVGFYFL